MLKNSELPSPSLFDALLTKYEVKQPERTCVECGNTFLQKANLRPMKFCGKKCRDKQLKRIDYKRPKAELIERSCDICSTTFQQKTRHQRFCSRICYTKSWSLNPEKNNNRSKARRKAKREWYAENEPRYYQNYRTRQMGIRPWRYVFQSRRAHAQLAGMEFTLTDEWCKSRWTGCCEITGMPFRKNPKGKGPHPFSCTLDRINPGIGYTQANSRFILWGCNALKGVGTDKDMFAIAQAITDARKR
jgi:endogenous inhibitor of DNA gyrase (YacG/DUF329 family)